MPEGNLALYSKSIIFGGIERNILLQADMLYASGIKLFIIAHHKSAVIKAVKPSDIRVIAFEKDTVFSLFQLTQKLIKENIKAVIIYKPRELKSGFFIKLFSLFKIKIVFYQQERINIEQNKFFLSFLSRWTDSWITPMSYLKSEIEKQGVKLKKEIKVIPHCLNLEPHFNFTLTVDEARKQLNLPLDRKIIGTLGRQNLEKRQDFLIRAINFLKLNQFSYDLLIMGNPKRADEQEYFEFLKELADECGLKNQIYFRPYVNDKLIFYRAINVFVKTNSGEACDLKAIESMATGTPVIAVQSKYNTDILKNGEVGMLYKANDLEDFSDKLIKMLSQQKIIDYFKETGLKVAHDRFDIQNNHHLFIDFARKLLS